jgi:hypothetical protein
VKYLVIENKGECEPGAFMLMGASTKRNQSGQIGQFGTGFNYSIAVLTREGIQPLVVSGNKRYSFSTDKVSIREHEFDRITVREGRKKPEPTQFTTAMGLGWSLVGAAKEIIANAWDEQEPRVSVSGEIMNLPGYTRVYVQLTEAVYDIYRQFDRYFTFRRKPLVSGDGWAIYKSYGPGTRVYRRGVQVFADTSLPACFDYQNDELPVREDRTSERYDCERCCAWIMGQMSVEQHCGIMDFLCTTEGETFEGRNNYLGWYKETLGPSFESLLNGRVAVTADELVRYSAELSGDSTVVFPQHWIDAFKGCAGIRTLRDVISAPLLNGHTIVEVPTEERVRLAAAIRYCVSVGVEIDESKIVIFEATAPGAPLGYAVGSTGAIMVNRIMLDRGVREIVKVLFEEFIHNLSQNPDYTRGFQHALIDQWVACLERFSPIAAAERASLLAGAAA